MAAETLRAGPAGPTRRTDEPSPREVALAITRKYTSPPIVEVLCQFNFNANAFDWTVPGLLYGALGHRYPNQSGQIQPALVGEKQEIVDRVVSHVCDAICARETDR